MGISKWQNPTLTSMVQQNAFFLLTSIWSHSQLHPQGFTGTGRVVYWRINYLVDSMKQAGDILRTALKQTGREMHKNSKWMNEWMNFPPMKWTFSLHRKCSHSTVYHPHLPDITAAQPMAEFIRRAHQIYSFLLIIQYKISGFKYSYWKICC